MLQSTEATPAEAEGAGKGGTAGAEAAAKPETDSGSASVRQQAREREEGSHSPLTVVHIQYEQMCEPIEDKMFSFFELWVESLIGDFVDLDHRTKPIIHP